MSPRQQSPLTMEYILLGMVDQKPSYGYDLYKKLTQANGLWLIWRLKQPQLYALLDKLEGEGYFSSTEVESGNFPNRKEYSITTRGKDLYQAWLRSPVTRAREMRQEFLAKMYFLMQGDTDHTLNLLKSQREVCQKWLGTKNQEREEIHSDQLFDLAVADFRIQQIQVFINWIEDWIAKLESNS